MSEVKAKSTTAPPPTADGSSRTAAFLATVRKAEQGDANALAAVREFLKGEGAADLLGGDTARRALNELVRASAGGNPVVQAATLRKLDGLRAELCGPSPTAVERLLVERAVATWLHLHHLEGLYASKESMPLNVGLYFQKCLTAAQKRYVAALRGLAEVRKFALPALVLNPAQEQPGCAPPPPTRACSQGRRRSVRRLQSTGSGRV